MSYRVGIGTTSEEVSRLEEAGCDRVVFDTWVRPDAMLGAARPRLQSGCMLVLGERVTLDAVAVAALTAGGVRVVALSDLEVAEYNDGGADTAQASEMSERC